MSGHSHPPLTKSEFIRGLECPKRLWLDRHKPGLRPPHSIAIQERIETGKRIQALAEKRYVDAAKVPYAGEDPDQAAKVTKEYLESDARHLLESTFVAEGRHVRADVLSRSPDGGWIIEEIKSSSVKEPKRLAKEDEAWDLAFQVLTARKAGIEVKCARLVLVDTSYVWSGEDYDPSSMLGVVDLTAECEELIAEAEERSEELLQILLNPSEPDA